MMSEKPKRELVSNIQPPSQCPACGSTSFERGMLMSSGYQEMPDDRLPIFPKPKALMAFRCLNCNRTEFYVDPELMRTYQSQNTRRVLIILAIVFGIYGIFGIIMFTVMR
jgi:predicted nucleic-acid-binding Zn-ribbon protein